MPLETFRGGDVPSLLARAQEMFGPDAAVVSVRRVPTPRGTQYEVVAGDAASARAQAAPAAPPRAFLPGEPAFPSPPSRPGPGAPRRLPPLGGGGFAWRLPGVGRDAAPAGSAPDFAAALRRSKAAAPVTIALVGPTGAGKTTTLAKLASHPRVFGARTPGVLCLDTYRVGAIEQSRAFAELARVPHEAAWSAADLDGARRRLKGCDVLLVDTAGRGPRQRADLAATFALLGSLAPDEIHLVVPAGLSAAVARRVTADFTALGITHLLASKCDEAPDDRGVFELAAELGIPMRWYTDGQEVPADLHAVAAPRLLARGARVPAEVA